MSSIKENIDHINRQIAETARACGRKPEAVQLIAVSKRKSVEAITQAIDAGARHFGDPSEVRLVAVSKTVPPEKIQRAVDAGLRIFGENYIQEAMEKIDAIGQEAACWHFIGHLQSNKARFAVKYFDFIHTVDTVKLARQIDNQAQKINKIQNILLQVNIADEATKSGTGIDEAIDLAEQIIGLANVSLQGFMCMPPYFSNPEQARPYFKQMVQIKEKFAALHPDPGSLNDLSMGMSNDFKVAIEEGSTMVRVGTAIFGGRD